MGFFSGLKKDITSAVDEISEGEGAEKNSGLGGSEVEEVDLDSMLSNLDRIRMPASRGPEVRKDEETAVAADNGGNLSSAASADPFAPTSDLSADNSQLSGMSFTTDSAGESLEEQSEPEGLSRVDLADQSKTGTLFGAPVQEEENTGTDLSSLSFDFSGSNPEEEVEEPAGRDFSADDPFLPKFEEPAAAETDALASTQEDSSFGSFDAPQTGAFAEETSANETPAGEAPLEFTADNNSEGEGAETDKIPEEPVQTSDSFGTDPFGGSFDEPFYNKDNAPAVDYEPISGGEDFGVPAADFSSTTDFTSVQNDTAAYINDNNYEDGGYGIMEAERIATDETASITEGMVVNGDIQTTGSLDLIGKVVGNVTCYGKLNITGEVEGSSNAAEVFAEAARINGDVHSQGSVKIGQSSVIIGNLYATSAVIAGAVKGDIDVHGPVILDTTAIVMGNIKSQSVQINNGAVIEGMCSQTYADVNPSAFFEGLKDRD